MRVTNKFDSVTIDAKVSPGAKWDLYISKTSGSKYPNKTVSLFEGVSKTAYIRVTAEDGIQKAYTITIYRQTKSDKPIISYSNNLVTIATEEESSIIYTTDGSEPTENNGTVYSEPFSAVAGQVIKAIAKGKFDDEYSDVINYTILEKTSAEIMPLAVQFDKKKNKLNYEFFIEATDNISGIFMIALYDSSDRLLKLYTVDTLNGEKEKVISGSLPIGLDTQTYKAFLWNDLYTIKPLADCVGSDF